MKILVTGGCGYIGSVLVPELLKMGHTVFVVDNLMYNNPSLLFCAAEPNLEFIRGDARDEQLIKELVSKVDAVIPLAALVGAPLCKRDPISAETLNHGAISMLIKHISKSQMVIYPNTNSGYGTKSGAVICDEETPLEPISLYGRTKVQAEKELLETGNAVTLRLATVFGVSPRMRIDLLVNYFTWEAVVRHYLIIFEKDFKRNYIHIRDVADAFIHCIENYDKMKANAYNCGLDEANYSKAELAEIIKSKIPNLSIHYAEIGFDQDKRNYIVSNKKLRKAGFKARRTVQQGVDELIKAYKMIPKEYYSNY